MTKHTGKYYLQYAAQERSTPFMATAAMWGILLLAPSPSERIPPSASSPADSSPVPVTAVLFGTRQEIYSMPPLRILSARPWSGDYDCSRQDLVKMVCCTAIRILPTTPVVIPEGKFDTRTVQPQYMLLSYWKPVTASSSLPGHEPGLAVNEHIRS